MPICRKHLTQYDGHTCPTCKSAQNKVYKAAHPEETKASRKKWKKGWNKRNPEKLVAQKARSRKRNPSARRARQARWNARNPEKVRAVKRVAQQNRRARKKQNGGRLSTGLVKRLLVLQKGKCTCCALPLGKDFHLDHKMPLALGGANDDSNIQLLRRECNIKKAAKHPINFMQERGFLL